MSNTNNMNISQQGSITRMTIGQPEAAPVEVPYESSKVSQGVTRFNTGHGSEVSQSGVTKYTVGQDRNTSSVAATLQRVNGADTVELIPGNPASRTHIRQALADGLIEPVGPGLWRDKGAAEGSASPAAAVPVDGPEAAPVDPGVGVFDPAEDEDWNAAIEPLPQFAYDAAAASVTVAVLSGADNLDKAAHNLAEQTGIPAELAAEYVQEGQAMYERVVAKEVAAMGIDAAQKPAFYEWLRQSKGRALHQAIQSLTAGRDVAPFRMLALEFQRYGSPQAATMRSRLR